MGRFLALLGPPTRPCPIGSDLLQRIDWPGLRLWTSHDMPVHILPAQAGLIIGQIFRRSDLKPVESDADVTPALTYGGKWLITHCYGSYVAILSAGAGTISIIRDPGGAMPCYYVENGRVLGSDARLVTVAVPLAPTIDWTRIASHLAVPGFREARTALDGLLELFPGHQLEVGASAKPTQLWSPFDHIEPYPVYNDAVVSRELRDHIIRCTQAWANQYEHIVLSLSGGLDSSIVAASLAGALVPIACLNLVASGGDGDERVYARQVASHFALPLIETHYDLSHVDIGKSANAHLPRPGGTAFQQSWFRHTLRLVGSSRHAALLNGNGGDNVFFHSQSATPLVDRYLAEGLSRGLFATLSDISRYNGASAFDVVQAARRKSRAGNRFLLKSDLRLLAPEIEVGQPDHPWLDAPQHILPGKAVHVGGLMVHLSHLEPFDRRLAPPSISPLLSQPVVEACLRIETWRWCAGATNRAVARQAFRHDLPAEIVERQSKGGPEGFTLSVFERHRSFIHARLMDGMLARQGLLDKIAIDRLMRERRVPDLLDVIRLLALVDAEAWVEGWS